MSGEALSRTKQVFRFLKAFAQRRMPVQRRLSEQIWTMRLAGLPAYPTIELLEVGAASSGDSDEAGGTEDSRPLLRVARPRLTEAPEPSPTLRDWLLPGWRDPHREVERLEERNPRQDPKGGPERFADDLGRVEMFDAWREKRDRWAQAERPAREAMKVFERLYDLRARIELESERVELMVGDGRLRVRTAAGDVDHPILLQRVELDFDPDVPELRVMDADRPPELFAALLSDDQITPETFRTLQRHVEEAGDHPLGGAATTDYLRRVVQQISARGRMVKADELGPITADPTISRDAALFLRVRMSGFPAAFEAVLEDLEKRQDVPISLTRLVGISPPEPQDAPRELLSPWGEPPDVLLSKPANREQVEIARALDRHKAVLVQGPPGTGKSHTIANIAGHLVAQGKRVLITSHTTKALRVLHQQLDPSLQPLCVSVLENDSDTRRQMEQSVRGILHRLTTSDASGLEREVEDLARARERLNQQIEQITADLRRAREVEYDAIFLAGEPIEPAEAARWVAASQEGNDWIPGPVEAGAPLPLSSDDLAELYGLTARLGPDEEAELSKGLPDAEALPGPGDFAEWVRDAAYEVPGEGGGQWTREASPADIALLEGLEEHLATMSSDLERFTPWQCAIVAAGYAGGAERDVWAHLRDVVQEAARRWEEARPVYLEFAPSLPPDIDAERWRRDLSGIVDYLESGGHLGKVRLFLKPRWKAIVRGARLNDTPPRNAAQFRALITTVGLQEGRRKLALRWQRLAEPVGLPPLSDLGVPPEPILSEYADQIMPLLGWWHSQWSVAEAAVREVGLRWDNLRRQEVARSGPAAPFERDVAILSGPLATVISGRLKLARREQADQLLRRTADSLASFSGPKVRSLADAVGRRDPEAYAAALHHIVDLRAKSEISARREELLNALETVAKRWAEAIRSRAGAHHFPTVPGDVLDAWRWRQLRQELDRRSALDEVRLMERLEQSRSELRNATADLIDRQAWLGQLEAYDAHCQAGPSGMGGYAEEDWPGNGEARPSLAGEGSPASHGGPGRGTGVDHALGPGRGKLRPA